LHVEAAPFAAIHAMRERPGAARVSHFAGRGAVDLTINIADEDQACWPACLPGSPC